MFDQYVQLQGGDPRWRRAMLGSTVASGVVTGALLGGMWLAAKLEVRRVDPPRNTVVVVQMMMDDPSAVPPPPPPPAGEGADAADEAAPGPREAPSEPVEAAPATELTQPEAVPDEIRPARARVPKTVARAPSSGGIPGAGPRGIPGGRPGGIPGGIPGALPGGIPGGFGPVGAVATKRAPEPVATVAKQPLAVVRQNAIFDPDCDAKKLASTKAATFFKRSGSTTVSFCVDERGRVIDVKTARRFRDDPQVDHICRQTVASWRFRPFMVGGKPQKTCSAITFDLVFE